VSLPLEGFRPAPGGGCVNSRTLQRTIRGQLVATCINHRGSRDKRRASDRGELFLGCRQEGQLCIDQRDQQVYPRAIDDPQEAIYVGSTRYLRHIVALVDQLDGR